MTSPDQVTTWTPKAVVALINERFDAAVTSARLIGSGAWSDCFRFESGGTALVIRIGRFGNDFLLDEFAGRNASHQLPVPQTRVVGRVGDEHYSVSEFAGGKPLETAFGRPEVAAALVDLLGALRATNVDQLSGWGRWTPANGGVSTTWSEHLLAVDQDPEQSRLHGWRTQLATKPHATRAFVRGYELLETLVTDDVPRSLVHNDLFNRNVHVDESRVVGVFDWGNSVLGDHLYDLALLAFWAPWWPALRAEPIIDAVRLACTDQAGSMASFDQRLRACMVHTALEHIAYQALLEDWDQVDWVIARLHETTELS